VTVLVTLVDEAETGEGEQFVDVTDEFRTARDEACEASGGDSAGIRAELGDHAFENAVDEADVAVVEADLEVVDCAGADDLGGLTNVDAGQAGGAGEEGVGRDGEARGNGSAEELALGGDAIEGSSSAEVDDDDRRVWACNLFEELVGGDAVDDAVGAYLRRIVGEDGQAGADTGFDEEWLDATEVFGGAAQGGVERRHDRGDNNAADLRNIERAQSEEVAEENAKLVDGGIAVGGDAPVGEQGSRGLWRGNAVETENRVGVADVDGEEHSLRSRYLVLRSGFTQASR
jgi:hypothetical protein